MSSPAGPEDRTPRHAGDGDAAAHQDARIHDARQDAAPQAAPRTNDTRVIPTGTAAPAAPADDNAAATRSHDSVRTGPVRTEPTRSQPVTAVRHDGTGRDGVDGQDTVVDEVPTRETVVAREKEQFGGIKIGSAFFGWLAATGMAVLLTALVAAAGTAVGLATNTDVNDGRNTPATRPWDWSASSCCWSSCSSPTTPAATSPAGWPASTAPSRALWCGSGP